MISTVTLWMLVTFGHTAYGGRNPEVIERFATMEECARVQSILSKGYFRPETQCIRMTVAVVK